MFDNVSIVGWNERVYRIFQIIPRFCKIIFLFWKKEWRILSSFVKACYESIGCCCKYCRWGNLPNIVYPFSGLILLSLLFHTKIYPFLKIQLKRKPSEKSNEQVIHDIMFPLGRRHVAFGSNQHSMEVLGKLMHKALMQTLPMEVIGAEKCEEIEKAYLELFKSIVYWIQFAFNYELKNSI